MTLPEKLKEETRGLHSQLENNQLLSLLTSEKITTDIYYKILSKFYGYFFPLEQSFLVYSNQLKSYLPDLAERRKSDWLLTDLGKVAGAKKLITTPEMCRDLPVINSPAAALGCLYVMEGSTLGGRFIAKHLSNTLGTTELTGAKFFNGYGENTGKRWKDFRDGLQSFSDLSDSENEVVIKSANSTFKKFDNWLSSANE